MYRGFQAASVQCGRRIGYHGWDGMRHLKIADHEYGVDCISMSICLGICVLLISNTVYLMMDLAYSGCCFGGSPVVAS